MSRFLTDIFSRYSLAACCLVLGTESELCRWRQGWHLWGWGHQAEKGSRLGLQGASEVRVAWVFRGRWGRRSGVPRLCRVVALPCATPHTTMLVCYEAQQQASCAGILQEPPAEKEEPSQKVRNRRSGRQPGRGRRLVERPPADSKAKEVMHLGFEYESPQVQSLVTVVRDT